jgi:3-hydroxy-9,10-secoandrosta-1,3,5(10)-triene-9,17-dione monooxygenase
VNLEVSAATRPAPIPPPERHMTPELLFERAIALRSLLQEQQDEADERGAYSPEMHEAFVKAGFYRASQPRLFGGYEFELETAWRCR